MTIWDYIINFVNKLLEILKTTKIPENTTGITGTTDSTSRNTDTTTPLHAAGVNTTKILVYNGEHSGINCASNTVRILRQKYTVNTTTQITAESLKGVNVLVLPGGDGGHAYLDHFTDAEEKLIKDFVFNGGGYFGTCAGAYLGAKEVYRDGSLLYKGLGIAPNINAYAVNYEGLTTVKIDGKIVTLAEYNGAAMKGGRILGTFNDNNTGYYNYNAICADTYGKGKTVLCGPHPELAPEHPEIMYNIIDFLTTSNGGTNMTSFTIPEITDAGKRVKTFIETNKRLPTTCKVKDTQVNMAEFLYLTCNVVIDYDKITKVDYKQLKDAPAPTGTYTERDASLSLYRDVCIRIRTHMNNNLNAPNYATITNIGTVPTNDLVYAASRVLNFINTNKRLPNTIQFKKITATPTPTPTSDIVQQLKDKTGKSFSNFTGLYALVVKYGRYCNPMYMDNQKSFNQAQQCVINEFKNIYDPEAYVQSPVSGQWTRRDCMTCVDWTQWGVKIAKAMGYQAIPYGVWCPGYAINHALFTIKGKEFTNWTVIDLAAAAAEGYSLGSHWCNAPSEDRKEPNWISYE